jgi:FkbM family methyltransferase
MKPSEALRQIIRRLTPKAAYGQVANLLDASFAIRRLGFWQYRKLTAKGQPDLRRIVMRGLAHEFWVRNHGSDFHEFINNILRQTYGQYFPEGKITSIIDAGANIGDTSVWYLNKFPDATVVAIEPHPGNFEILKRNCEPYGSRAKLVRGALWNKPQVLPLKENSSNIAHRVGSIGEGYEATCCAFSVPDLMRQFRLDHIDIFKCDIEGAENEVLDGADQWLSKTRSIVIELHNPQAHVLMSSLSERYGWKQRRFRNSYYYL